MTAMFLAELICSDEACSAAFEAIGSLEELDTLACECGCGLVVVSLSGADGSDEGLQLERLDAPRRHLTLAAARRHPPRDAAARRHAA